MGPEFALDAKAEARMRQPRDLAESDGLLRIDLGPNEAGDENAIKSPLIADQRTGLHRGPHDSVRIRLEIGPRGGSPIANRGQRYEAASIQRSGERLLGAKRDEAGPACIEAAEEDSF